MDGNRRRKNTKKEVSRLSLQSGSMTRARCSGGSVFSAFLVLSLCSFRRTGDTALVDSTPPTSWTHVTKFLARGKEQIRGTKTPRMSANNNQGAWSTVTITGMTVLQMATSANAAHFDGCRDNAPGGAGVQRRGSIL
jgi:hypothetical protein